MSDNTIHIRDFKGKRVHFSGIGGASMNGLAQILDRNGYIVTGSDIKDSLYFPTLRELGIPITIGQSEQNLIGADLVVYSSALHPDNVERVGAQKLGIPMVERATLLGQISDTYGCVAGIAGCHGKTTTSSMLSLIALTAGLDPTAHVGGSVPFLQCGTHVGKSDIFITEACEYLRSFLHIAPTLAVITNIDDDHLDYFADIEDVYSAYKSYLDGLREGGIFFACIDDPYTQRLYKEFTGNKRSFGIRADADLCADKLTFDAAGNAHFDVVQAGEKLFHIDLRIPGEHNVRNALAAIAVALELDCDAASIAEALGKYTLTKRRFEYYGNVTGVEIYHDFAHHPGEIKAALSAAANLPHKKLWVIFQVNSFTRAKTLYEGFVSSFGKADEVIVLDIYPGRDLPEFYYTIHSKELVGGMARHGVEACYIPTMAEARAYLDQHWQPGDLVMVLGSGNVDTMMPDLVKK